MNLHPSLSNLSQQIMHWVQDDKFVRRAGLALSIASVISGVLTYIVMTSSGTFSDKSYRILPMIYLDLTLLLMLSLVIVKRLIELWSERRRNQAGSRLHVQIVVLFSFVTVIPAITVAIFSALFFNVGIQAWFSDPVRAALNEASIVSNAYLNEHNKSIKHDAIFIKNRLAPQIKFLISNPEIFSQTLTDLSEEHNLSELMVVNDDGKMIARSIYTFVVEFERSLRRYLLEHDQVAFMTNNAGDRVRATIKIDSETNTYLYVGKMIDPAVLNNVQQTRGAIAEYNRLDEQQSTVHITFILFFAVVALLLLFVSIWAGLTVANFFVRPISKLIVAADRVRQGDLSAQVESEEIAHNELDLLTDAFNKMTDQLQVQHQNLKNANAKSDQRRQFMEAVLTRVSAGVLSIGANGQIRLINQKARDLLMPSTEISKDMLLKDLAPELSALIEEQVQTPDMMISKQITIMRGGVSRVLQVSIVIDTSIHLTTGYIITFDDVTPLMMAQRKAAWSDVARRIAHEIKNPLTPIQLSAERLKRKYTKEIQSDPQTFQNCIDTIVRQVGHIGKLVGEFSSFARMPEPVMQLEDLSELCRQAVFLQRQAHPDIEITFTGEQAVSLDCDAGQIGQVLTNLLQNAINAIGVERPDYADAIIEVKLTVVESQVFVTIEDNGPGFPIEGRERLTEPYFTTHAKGNGLGLAIVSKIIDDHRGHLELGDSALGGAKVILVFSLTKR